MSGSGGGGGDEVFGCSCTQCPDPAGLNNSTLVLCTGTKPVSTQPLLRLDTVWYRLVWSVVWQWQMWIVRLGDVPHRLWHYYPKCAPPPVRWPTLLHLCSRGRTSPTSPISLLLPPTSPPLAPPTPSPRPPAIQGFSPDFQVSFSNQ